MTLASALYTGRVAHARVRPRRHRLGYRIFMLLIDLDELQALGRLKTLGLGRFNLVGFDARRYGDGSSRPLKAQVEAELATAGLAYGGPVRLMTMPQVLGRGFNPLTVYFCHRGDGALSAILYEVNNTFGERHSYLIPAPATEQLSHACDKRFYVSPFMDMDMAYAFDILQPGEAVRVAVEVADADGPMLSASFAGARRKLTDGSLVRACLSHPWMFVGVLAAIHIEALKIWLKGVKFRHKPAPPARRVTVAPSARLAA